MTSDVLIFEIENVLLALPVEQVHEVVHAVALSKVPGHLSDYEGLLNYRGTPVLVFDLRRRLRLPARSMALSDCLILSNLPRHRLAFRADRSLELYAPSRMKSSTDAGDIPHADLFHGLIEYGERLAFVLDPFRCLPQVPPSHEGTRE